MTTFALTDEQELLRDTARRFLAERSPVEVVREIMETTAGVDDALWSQAAELGWSALLVPEEHGGAGFGMAELGVVFEECGAALACLPLLSSGVLAPVALLAAGSDEQRKTHLPGLASGVQRGTLAHLGPSGRASRDEVAVTATRANGGYRLDGEASWVLDGHTADLVVVAASIDETAGLFVVPGESDGLTRERLDTLDQTRTQARLTFDGVTLDADARLGDGDAWDAVTHAVTAGVVALANEQLGGAQHVLDTTVAYASQRHQFGRAIGSFQAIKHRLAEMLVHVESARSVALHAARALDEGDADELAVAAPLAKSWCSDVFERAAAEMIQVHGGIGFTWEHEAHLYFKRAKTDKLLFGDPASHRAALADTLGL